MNTTNIILIIFAVIIVGGLAFIIYSGSVKQKQQTTSTQGINISQLLPLLELL